MPDIRRIVDHPTTITPQNLEMVIAPAVSRYQSSIVLSAAAKVAPVALCDIHVVIHRDGETFAAVRPSDASVFTYVESTVIGIIDATCRCNRHQEMMMISVRIIVLAALGIPSRHSCPRLASVGAQMQVDATAKN